MSIQSDSRGPTAVEASILKKEGFDPSTSAGVFVGISVFEDSRFAPVPFAVDDAVDLAHLFAIELQLLRPERAVLALAGEPKKAETAERLAHLLAGGARRVSGRQTDIYRFLSETSQRSEAGGLFLLTIATHGMSDQGGDFLVATDSFAGRSLRTGVAVDEVLDDVSRAGSPRRLVLLDSCRERLSEETRGQADAAMTQTFADAISRAVGQVVLSGATVGGFAYDDLTRGNGVFTAAVVDGLRGAAPVDDRGFITVSTLADFLQSRVETWVRCHRPDHAGRSLGIGQRLEGAAAALPLAVDPELVLARARYRARRAAGLASVRANLGFVLKGKHLDLAESLLPPDDPSPSAEELLEEIEALDGGARSQRSLRDFLRELYGPRRSDSAALSLGRPLPASPSDSSDTSRDPWRTELETRPVPPANKLVRVSLRRTRWPAASGLLALIVFAGLASNFIWGSWLNPEPPDGPASSRFDSGWEAFRGGDYEQARRHWEKGCATGEQKACAQFGEAHRVGIGGLTQDPEQAIELVRQACDANDPLGCTYLGHYHYSGIGSLKLDQVRAVRLYRRACDAGELLACAYLGDCYRHGLGNLAKSKDQAVALYRKACDGEQSAGCFSLGLMYWNGEAGWPMVRQKAVTLFRQACNSGTPSGCAWLGFATEDGEGGVEKDEVQAVALYRRACDGGSPSGCSNLGYAYGRGLGGLPKSEAQANILYRRACQAGNSTGCRNLGISYEFGGLGAPKNEKQAVALYRRACDLGLATGCLSLGNAYADGKGGLTKDLNQALILYIRACDDGAYEGCHRLGLAYDYSSGGLSKDRVRAEALYRRACDGGYAYACTSLGLFYDLGRGGAKEEAKAVAFYRRGCDADDPEACRKLAFAHRSGKGGLAKNEEEAIALFRRACYSGDRPSCNQLDKLP